MRFLLQNKADIALVTDPDGGREWAAMGGCWDPDRKTFVTDPEVWAAMGGCWGPDRKSFVPQSPKMHGKFSHK